MNVAYNNILANKIHLSPARSQVILYICLTDASRADVLNRRGVRGLEITNEIEDVYRARHNILEAKGKYEKAEYCPTKLRSL
jgi:uncharacterized protein YacL